MGQLERQKIPESLIVNLFIIYFFKWARGSYAIENNQERIKKYSSSEITKNTLARDTFQRKTASTINFIRFFFGIVNNP